MNATSAAFTLEGAWGATLIGFGLLFFRAAALLSAAPIFGARPVPARVRLVLALLLAFMATSHGPAALVPTSTVALLVAIASETLLGLVVGGSARAFLEAGQAAGHTLGLTAGLGFSATLDPTNGAPSTAVGELINALALLTALGLGLHRDVVAWFCSSAAASPPGTLLDVWTLAETAVRNAIEATALAVRIAIPVAAAILCAHGVLGLVSRAVPQMSLGNLGFAVPLLAGGWALARGAEDMAALVAQSSISALRALGGG